MKRTEIGVIIAMVVFVVGGWIVVQLLRPTQQASAPIAAVPLTIAAPDGTVFTIDPAQSRARFTLGEVLRGVPTTVVGVTNQVSGQIALDLAAPDSAEIGVIQINARTLETDSPFRNRAIGNEILRTGQYEFIVFTPTGVTGLPQAVALGEAVPLQIAGELTVRDVTQPVVFEALVSAESPTQLSGSATATILRSDFGLTIPDVPNVASVDDAVQLTIDFVALTAAN
jgi:polyisoprenoid-binding protein YceI